MTFSVKGSHTFSISSKWHHWCQSSHCHRQRCKWQPIVDLGNGIYLRTNQIRALTILGYPTDSPTRTPSALHLPCFDSVGSSSRKSCWFMLSHCSVISLGITDHSPCASYGICFHTSLWSPGSSHTSRIFPPARIFTSFFTNPFFYNTTSCFQKLLVFSTSSDQSLYRSATGDQMGDALSCLSITWKIQDMQHLFGPGVTKIYDKATQWLQLTSGRLLLEMFTHIHNYLQSANIYNLSFFFFPLWQPHQGFLFVMNDYQISRMPIQPVSLGVIFSIVASINYGKLGSLHQFFTW